MRGQKIDKKEIEETVEKMDELWVKKKGSRNQTHTTDTPHVFGKIVIRDRSWLVSILRTPPTVFTGSKLSWL